VAVLARLVLGRDCPPIVMKVSNSLERDDFGQPMHWFYGLWLRIQTLFIDRFVGLAEAMRPEMATALGVEAERLAVVYDPALSREDIARAATLAAATPRQSRRLFVGVGRLAPQKNFSLLIEAFARIAEEGDRLAIVGEGPERRRLERLTARLGVADKVDMPGHVADVVPWLAAADVFVLSSRYEGVPAAVLEALAVGVPIVATDCCVSMGELLGGGALGRLTPPGDSVALADAMRQAAESEPRDPAAMRAQAERFTVERSGSRYLVVMNSAVADHRGVQEGIGAAGLPRFGRAVGARSE
jgi:glycosyltransferase involved in cell wall biosynthesis